MPKNPPDLPRLQASTSPADRVQVQQTAFSYDVIGRYVCNDWGEVTASLADGGFPFDVVVVGAGMYGGYCAEKLYRLGADLGLRILVLDAGATLFATHIQNLPQRLGGSVGGPAYNRTREDGSGTQNVVWGMPWISNIPFPGLAYCLGGRSLFWGGWSPRLTAADLANWPADVAAFLTQPAAAAAYDDTEAEIGAVPTADFMLPGTFHDDLKLAFQNTIAAQPRLTSVTDAPLAVLGSAPESGLFPFDKFSSAPFLIDAVRNDVAVDTAEGDVSRRIFVMPRTQVLRLHRTASTVTSMDLVTDGTPQTMTIPASCAVILANGTIEATRIALDSLGIGDTTFGSPRAGNLLAHLRSNITVRIKRAALGLPAAPPKDLETTAFLVRGTGTGGRQFHFQVTAAAVGGANPEKNMFQQVPDIDTLDQIRANQDPVWITIVFRGIGEMEDARSLAPDPARSWIDLSGETDQFGVRRAYVNLVPTGNDKTLWTEMDTAAFDLAAALAGNPADIEYLQSDGTFGANRPQPNPAGPGTSFWNDGLGTTHHEAGTLFMGAPGSSLTDISGRLHGIDNVYVAGPALFPTLGSANPSLTALSLARRSALTIVTDRTMSPSAGFTSLSLNPLDWTLVAQPGTNPAVQHLGKLLETAGGYGLYYYTKQQFGDAVFWVEWRELRVGDNSGVYVRTPGPGGASPLTQADALGHEIQIDDLGGGNPAGLDIHRTGAIYGLQAPSTFPARPPGEWNTYLIETAGPKIKVTLNGVLVNDYTSTREQSGFLALQVHSFPSKIQFRNLQFK
jgi:3-keto-disaccharide hydrolase/GMC oxidoreductase